MTFVLVVVPSQSTDVAAAVKWLVAPMLWVAASIEFAAHLADTSIQLGRGASVIVKTSYTPGHPDGCAGLRPVTRHLGWGLIPFLVGVCALSAVTAVTLIPALEAKLPMLVLQSEFLLFANTGLAAGTVMMVMFFAWPTWQLHRHMVEAAASVAAAHSEELRRRAEAYQSALSAGSPAIASVLDAFKSLSASDPVTLGYVEWPLEIRTVRRLVGAGLVALAGPIATFVKTLLAP